MENIVLEVMYITQTGSGKALRNTCFNINLHNSNTFFEFDENFYFYTLNPIEKKIEIKVLNALNLNEN